MSYPEEIIGHYILLMYHYPKQHGENESVELKNHYLH